MAQRDIDQLIRQVQSLGFKVTRTKRNHYKIHTPKGILTCPSTTSEYRAYLNTRADLRRNGVPV